MCQFFMKEYNWDLPKGFAGYKPNIVENQFDKDLSIHLLGVLGKNSRPYQHAFAHTTITQPALLKESMGEVMVQI